MAGKCAYDIGCKEWYWDLVYDVTERRGLLKTASWNANGQGLCERVLRDTERERERGEGALLGVGLQIKDC